MRIWVIDDEEGVLNMLGAALEFHGHEVRAFRDPREVPFDGPEPAPDMVILDWTIGGQPALSWMEQWRLRLTGVRWVVISGDPSVRAKLPAGVGWLDKPFHLGELAELVNRES
ncbi:MAG: hypothetical protein K6U87_00275 [Firmicutes bacterium]|nr:hypothetical protein [Bacillota bacterium]